MKKQSVEARRTEILETTCQVVIDRGFAGTRISDVAKRLDVSTSLIHYHFDSKEQLLAEAFAHYASKDLAEMAADIEAAPTALAQLDRAIRANVPEGSDDVEWMLWIDAWGEALRNPLMKSISQELDLQSIELLERVIRRGVDSGEFRCNDPAGSAMRLAGLIDGLAVQFAAHTGVLNRERLLHHVHAMAAYEVGITVGAFEGDPTTVQAAPPPPAVELALRRLVDTYCDAVHRRDPAAWGATWSDDGTWDLGGGPAISGREAILSAWESAMSGFEWVVQTAPTAVFEVDEHEGTATGRVTVQERFRSLDGASGSILGIYHDRYVRTGADWRFAERRLEVVELT